MLPIGLGRLFQNFRQRSLLLSLTRRAGSLFGGGVVLRNLQPILAGEIVHGLDESHSAVLHEEADRVAMRAAAEAVIELLGGADRERGRLLPVERAKPHEIGARLFE